MCNARKFRDVLEILTEVSISTIGTKAEGQIRVNYPSL